MKAILEHLDIETQCFAIWLQRFVWSVVGLIVALLAAAFIGEFVLRVDIAAPAWTSTAIAMWGFFAARFVGAPLLLALIKQELR